MASLQDKQLEKNPSSCQNQADLGNTSSNRGGWITLPFIIGSTMGLSLAAGCWYASLTVFLIREYNIRNDVANRIYNIMNIGVNLLPTVGALVADSSVGSFLVINVSSFASLLGLIMLGLSTTIIPSLRPHQCNDITHILTDTKCESPSSQQYTFLLVALSLAIIGFGCTRFMLSSLGVYQFNKKEHRRIFFNVYILAYEVCWAISYALGVFIVQEKVSWAVSFGIGIAGNTIAIVIFLSGSKYYRHDIPQANPVIGMSRVLLSVAIRKLGTFKTKNNRVYDDEFPSLEMVQRINPSKSHRSLNQASLVGGGPNDHDAAHNNNTLIMKSCKSWSQNLLHTTQIDDLKRLTKIIPVWSTGILLNFAVTTSSTLVVLQASTMDLTIFRPHFKIPPTSITIISLIITALTVSIFDRILIPMWQKIVGKPLKPLQRSGVGHVFVMLGMIGLALVEIGRLNSVKTRHSTGQSKAKTLVISALWLVFPLALLGIGAAYYFPGGLTFHYQEFPRSLKNTSTAVPTIQVVTGYYLSKAFVNLVKHKTSWLPDDSNLGRLDLAYWILAIIVAINFGYFLICAHLYKYNIQDPDGEPTQSQP